MATSIKIRHSLKDRVQHLAGERRHSPHWIMLETIRQYVDREEKCEDLKGDALRVLDEYQKRGCIGRLRKPTLGWQSWKKARMRSCLSATSNLDVALTDVQRLYCFLATEIANAARRSVS